MSIGVPVKLLHEAEGHIVTVEIKTGEVYRGHLLGMYLSFPSFSLILVAHPLILLQTPRTTSTSTCRMLTAQHVTVVCPSWNM